MKITLAKIKELEPSELMLSQITKCLGENFDIEREFNLSDLVGDVVSIKTITWILGKTDNKLPLVKFAVYCAELVLPIFEKKNNSKAPRKCINLVNKWINDNSSVSKEELNDAAYAAYAAAYAAAANAAYAAYAAAYAAAAYAAAAANAAADSAADAAAYVAMKEKIKANLMSQIDNIGKSVITDKSFDPDKCETVMNLSLNTFKLKPKWDYAFKGATHIIRKNNMIEEQRTFHFANFNGFGDYLSENGVQFNDFEVIEAKPKTVDTDVVRNPKHYHIIEGVESIELIASSMTLEMFKGFCLGNILKYRIRAGKKDALEQDIKKAEYYEELYETKKHLCRKV